MRFLYVRHCRDDVVGGVYVSILLLRFAGSVTDVYNGASTVDTGFNPSLEIRKFSVTAKGKEVTCFNPSLEIPTNNSDITHAESRSVSILLLRFKDGVWNNRVAVLSVFQSFS